LIDCELKGVTPNYCEMVSRLMKVDIVLRIYSGVYATRLVSYVNGLRTPRNNASANALVNVDRRTYCVHKLAYYRHDVTTYITLFCLYKCSCCVLRRCILSRFSSAVAYLLICNVVTPRSCCGIIGIVRWQMRTQPYR